MQALCLPPWATAAGIPDTPVSSRFEAPLPGMKRNGCNSGALTQRAGTP
jgi:hypothetical protein